MIQHSERSRARSNPSERAFCPPHIKIKIKIKIEIEIKIKIEIDVEGGRLNPMRCGAWRIQRVS